MHRVGFKHVRLQEPQQFSALASALRGVVLGLFVLSFAVAYARLWQPGMLFGNVHWPEGLLLVAAAAALLASLSAQLPAQNVMLASLLIALLGGTVHLLGALTGIPFGPFAFTPQFGQKLVEPLPWTVPFLWLVAILACRGVARLILRPWRQRRNYGFWLLGLSAGLVVLLDFSLEPYATQVQRYWVWHPTRLKLEWYSAPAVNFLGWGLSSALVLAFVTPSLINKKPVTHYPRYEPLLVWLLLNLLFATSAAQNRLWPAVWVTTSGALVTTSLAVLGGSAAANRVWGTR